MSDGARNLVGVKEECMGTLELTGTMLGIQGHDDVPMACLPRSSNWGKKDYRQLAYLIFLIQPHIFQIFHDELQHPEMPPLGSTVQEVVAILKKKK